MICIGIIGAGRMGARHVKTVLALAASQDLRLAGVYDPDPAAALRTHADLGQLIGACDALIVSSPNEHHHVQALRCLHHGRHVLVEKPMTLSAAHARELCEEARRRGCVLSVGHSEVFNPAWQALRRFITWDCIYGVLSFERFSPLPSSNTNPIDDLLVHDFALALDLQDDIAIRAANWRGRDHVLLSGGFSGCGARESLILFEGGFCHHEPRRMVTIHSANRSWTVNSLFEVDLLRKTLTETRKSPVRGTEKIPHPVPPTDPLQEQLRAFVHCIRDRREGTAELGHLAVALADQAKQYGRP